MRKFSLFAAAWAMGASGLVAQAAPILTFSTTAVSKPGNLVQYTLHLNETGSSVGVAGLSLTITPSAAGHLNQVFPGSTRFQDNNALVTGFGADVSLDSQFLFTTNNNTINTGPSPSQDDTNWPGGCICSIGHFGAAVVCLRDIAQVVLPAEESATFTGQVTFFQGLEAPQNVSGVIPVPEPAGLAFIGLAGAGLFRRNRKA